jgi:hypothetical protein
MILKKNNISKLIRQARNCGKKNFYNLCSVIDKMLTAQKYRELVEVEKEKTNNSTTTKNGAKNIKSIYKRCQI